VTTLSTPELAELRSVTEDYVRGAGEDNVGQRAPADGFAFDRATWKASARALGLPGVLVPEAFGGLGFGLGESLSICEVLGAMLHRGPFLSSAVVATTALSAAGDAASELLGALNTGEEVAVLVSDLLPPSRAQVHFATGPDDDSAINGTAPLVVGAAEADALIVPVRAASGIELRIVRADAPGVTVAALRSLDLTRPLSLVQLDGARGTTVASGAMAREALSAATVAGHLGLAADSLGCASRALAMTVEYAGQRVQFGRLIGSFQAVKHRCADLLVAIERGRSAQFAALGALGGGAERRQQHASLAKTAAADAAFVVGRETVHLHGGIGFTWEHPAHLFYRRGTANQLVYGRAADHHQQIVETLLGATSTEGNTP